MSITLSDALLFLVVSGLAVNYAVLRLPRWHERRGIFWATQLLNLTAACLLLVRGIPEFQGDLRFANWMLGLLFLFHIVSNNNRLQAALRQHRSATTSQEDAQRTHIREALRRGQQNPSPPDQP